MNISTFTKKSLLLLALLSVVHVSDAYAFRGGEGGARVQSHPNYAADRAYSDRAAYNRGYENGAVNNVGGFYEDNLAPVYAPATQGVQETPGYTDPYQSNDSIDPSYDQD